MRQTKIKSTGAKPMAFIARQDKPCTQCGQVIPKGATGNFTWDRVPPGGFIHLECLKARKGGGAKASPAIGVCQKCLKDVLADEPSIEQNDKFFHATCVMASEAEEVCTRCRIPKVRGPNHYTPCEFFSPIAEGEVRYTPLPAPAPELKVEESRKKTRVSVGTTNGAADELAHLIQKLAGQRGIDEVEVRRIAADEAAKVSVNRTVSISIDKAAAVKFDVAHMDLPAIIRLASMRDDSGHRPNLYLYGPAGSGKSTGARQVAKALFPDQEDKYGYISLNPQTPESRLVGYMHAGGEYVATDFFKKFTGGGVFCIDEIDNAAAALLATLNGLLANGHGAFPHGMFTRHPDFVCIATGNTIGLGGDVNYPERRPLDGATRDRFYFWNWAYDMDLIKSVLSSILGDGAAEFMSWVKREAQELQARFPTHIVSPRAYIQGASLEKVGGYTRNQIREMVIARGLK